MSIARAGTSLLRIRYMSDLHLEFSDFTPPPLEADIVVLAGDIHTGTEGLDWAARSFPETPVLYLPGNHEYYGFDLPTLYRELAAYAKRLGIHFMNNQEVIVGGVRIIGSTIWTDFKLLGPSTLAMLAAETGMNDYQQITHGDRSLRPIDTKSLHDIGRYYLECKLEEPFEGKTFVQTIDGLGQGVVITVAGAADEGLDAPLVVTLAVANRKVLRTEAAVVNEPVRCRSPGMHRLLECIQDKIYAHMPADAPPNDETRKCIGQPKF